jgi:hypothetical protein
MCNCPDNATLCSDRCADLSSDPAHCGGCDKPCAGTCASGVCQPDPDGGMPDAGDPDGGDLDGGPPDGSDDPSP